MTVGPQRIQNGGKLPTVTTGRPGGHHVYFQINPTTLDEIRQELGKTLHGALSLGDGELKVGKGSYVVAPPSIHANGNEYKWIIPLSEVIPVVDPRKAGLLNNWSPDPPPMDTEDTENPSGVSSEPPVSSVSMEERIREVVQRTLPQSLEKKRHASIFVLARALKAFPDLSSKPASSLKTVVTDLCISSGPVKFGVLCV